MKTFLHSLGLASFLIGGVPAAEAAEIQWTTVKHGPFQLGATKETTVAVEVLAAEQKGPKIEWPKTDAAVTVRNAKGEVVHRRNYPVTGAFELKIAAAAVDLPGGSRALLIMREFAPSAPATGVDGQFFAFDPAGQFVPITGVIAPSCNDAAPSNFPVREKTIGGVKCVQVESVEWTGHFAVLRHFPVDLAGVAHDAAQFMVSDHYPVRVSAEDARRIRKSDYPRGGAVRLFKQPRPADAQPVQAHVQPGSRIEFLDAVQAETQWWLHVKIDGREGYVTGEEDFHRLGLPAAG